MINVIKKVLIITGAVIGIVAVGYYLNAMFTEQKQATQEAMDAQHQALKEAALSKSDTPAIVSSTANDITVEFAVTEIDNNGYVHGENPDGSKGQGIVYSLDTFKKYGISDVKVGDTIDVTWSIDDYEASDFTNVKNIMQIDSNK